MNPENSKFIPRFNPEFYDSYSVPIYLEPYALDLKSRIDPSQLKSVLEIACGTGALTKHLGDLLPPGSLTASDINSDMHEFAKNKLQHKEIKWVLADASQLPFENESFDLVICQFGYMFTDKHQAFREACRVLRKGGSLLFNSWDEVKYNAANQLIQQVYTQMFGELPTECFTPFSINNPDQIRSMLEDSGFSDITIEKVSKNAIASTAMHATIAAAKAGLMHHEIMKRKPDMLQDFINRLHAELKQRFGDSPMIAPMQAIVSRGWKR